MADHGQAHVRGKQFCYEEGLHIPLIIRWPKDFPTPRGFQPGTVDDRLIEAIDLAPTFLAIAGEPKPAGMQGQIFLGDRAEPPRRYAFGARDRCDETVFRFRTVRDDRYRYIRNFTPDRPFLQPNDYKERSYPVWNLLKELARPGQADPGPGSAHRATCRPRNSTTWRRPVRDRKFGRPTGTPGHPGEAEAGPAGLDRGNGRPGPNPGTPRPRASAGDAEAGHPAQHWLRPAADETGVLKKAESAFPEKPGTPLEGAMAASQAWLRGDNSNGGLVLAEGLVQGVVGSLVAGDGGGELQALVAHLLDQGAAFTRSLRGMPALVR